MRVTAPHLPGLPELDIDTGRGKLAASLDLRATDDRDWLRALVREAHILVQGYRPGGLAAKGFSPEALAEMRPGLVVVTLTAYGHAGPWAGRRGFDSLVQNACGINVAEAEAAGVPAPKELPAQALDHATGYLMAFGALMALIRKARDGGSWHVRVSLAQTAHWLAGLGRVGNGFACEQPTGGEIRALTDQMDTPFRQLRQHAASVRHAAFWTRRPCRSARIPRPLRPAQLRQARRRPVRHARLLARPPVPLGTHAPVWPV